MQRNDDANFDNLPLIDLSSIRCTAREFDLVQKIVYTKNDGTNILRATRPKQEDESRWLWRKVMQAVSPEEKFHAATPQIDEYLLPDSDIDSLHSLLDAVLAVIPEKDKHGMRVWARVNGVT
jgi:hypothetical protein